MLAHSVSAEQPERQSVPCVLHWYRPQELLVEPQTPDLQLWVVLLPPVQLGEPQLSPSGCVEQVPSFPVRLQASQLPVQAVSQQTPLAQKPLLQASGLVPHGEPFGSWLTHEVPAHWKVPVQSALEEHEVLQAPVESQA